jgi:hypothetical protein
MTDPSGDRRRIADYLVTHGPTHGDRLAENLGMTLGRFWPLINCAWFDIVTGGWGLTERGKQEAFGQPVAAAGK